MRALLQAAVFLCWLAFPALAGPAPASGGVTSAPAAFQAGPVPGAAEDDLLAMERRTIAIFKEVSPSVVAVANRAVLRDLNSLMMFEVPQGAGSGFVWDKQGHIISNFHVVFEAASLQVTLHDGNTYEAKVVGVDPDHDLAVLKITAPESVLVPIRHGASAYVRVGQTVLAIGNPYGLDTSLSVGVVSALGRSIISMTQRPIFDLIQTDAAINPGNSGGPLLDTAGRLVGINTMIVSPSGGYSGVGFAIPSDTVRRVVPQLIATGKVRRAGLGVQLLPEHVTIQAGVTGAAILRVFPGTAAARAGLQGVRSTRAGGLGLGDVIVEIDRTPVRRNDDFLAALDRRQVGDSVNLVVVRDGQRREVAVKLQTID